MSILYHFTTAEAWATAQAAGRYTAPSLASEGFIHCSTEKQVLHVANAFYRGQNNLVLLKVNEAKLKPELKWEPPAGQPAPGISESDSFPHIYGAINIDAVESVIEFPCNSDGQFSLPAVN